MIQPPIPPAGDASASRAVYTVSALNRAAKRQLEQHFERIWLEGELSNLAAPSSGHLYFSLKDAQAQIRCALFKGNRHFMRTKPLNGQQVLVRGRLGLYEPRGDYQLIVEHLEPAGQGALELEYQRRKAELAAAGLFEQSTKRAVPTQVERIGIITSASGAAFQDIRQVLARRAPQIGLILYPCSVQGDGAAEQLCQRLGQASQRQEVDVLILARGGGSIEDLWAFNDPRLVEAVARCPIPLVTGVGHEIDFTLVDFAADQRAPTPSAAAELVSTDQAQQRLQIEQLQQRLLLELHQVRRQAQAQQQALLARLQAQHPKRQLDQRQQRLDEAQLRLERALINGQNRQRFRLNHATQALHSHSPKRALKHTTEQLNMLSERLGQALKQQLQRQSQRLAHNSGLLQELSPLNTLARGYAIIHSEPENQPIKRIAHATIGEPLRVRLHDGELRCRVLSVHPSKAR